MKLKRNVKGKSHGSKAWKNMVHDYRRNPEEWKRKYHFRSSAESAFSALKRKFGYRLSAIRKDLQRKELMTKIIAYNLNIQARVLIQRQSHLVLVFRHAVLHKARFLMLRSRIEKPPRAFESHKTPYIHFFLNNFSKINIVPLNIKVELQVQNLYLRALRFFSCDLLLSIDAQIKIRNCTNLIYT